MSIILGIDPGSRITGYGIIRSLAGRCEYLGSGCIRTSGDVLAPKLKQIYDGVSEVILQFRPDLFAIEQVFMARNPDSALKLGQARGAAIVAAVNAGLDVAEYSARQVKQSVVGTGAADKEQVQHMVRAVTEITRQSPGRCGGCLGGCPVSHPYHAELDPHGGSWVDGARGSARPFALRRCPSIVVKSWMPIQLFIILASVQVDGVCAGDRSITWHLDRKTTPGDPAGSRWRRL